MTIALTTARYGFETVPPIPPRKVAERTDYGRIVELLASGKAGAVQAAPELRGWLTWLDGGKERRLSPARRKRLDALERAEGPRTSHGPRLAVLDARREGRATARAEGRDAPKVDLPGWLNGERPPAPADWQRARRVLAVLDLLFRLAR